MESFQSTEQKLTNVVVTDLSSPAAARGSNGTVRSGTNSNGPLAAGSALVISFVIGRRYRGGHPRIYIIGMTQNRLADAQTWDPSGGPAVVTGFEDFITDILASPWTGGGPLLHVNVSYFKGFTNLVKPSGRAFSEAKLNPAGPVVDDIISYRLNPKVASQRRRNTQGS